jgi:hypothetical protein
MLTPFEIVQRQLEAYNRRDIEAFIALFADDACGFELGSSVPTMEGKEAVRARYQALFASSPKLHSAVLSRIAFGRTVVDLERIAGRNGSIEPVELLLIYEVVDQRIQRFYVVRND